MSKVRIVLDPTKWPTDTFNGRGTYNHIRYDQPASPPEALWEALRLWSIRRPRVDSFQNWWKDLSEFDSSLRGWKIVGRGEMPQTVLIPGEKPHKGDTKLSDSFSPPKKSG